MTAVVTGIGARSPVGLTAEQTAFGIRMSHLAPRRTRFQHAWGEPVGMSLLSALGDDLEGRARMVPLATRALTECVAMDRAGAPTGAARPIVLVGCPSPRPGFAAEDARALLDEVIRAAELDVDAARCAAFAVGHASFAVALVRALEALEADDVTIYVGAVDSHHDGACVEHLDAELRVQSARTPDGFVPAEGAGFVALRSARGAHARPLADVIFAATDLEHTIALGRPNLARAATDLLERAGRAARPPLGWYLRTTNRERHRGREDRFVSARLGDVIGYDAEVDELGAHMGDPGAASGALLAVLAAQGFASDFAPQGDAVLSLASDGPERGIVVMRRHDG